MTNFNEIALKLRSLVLFRSILGDGVTKRFLMLTDSLEKGDAAVSVGLYANFCSALFAHGTDFGAYILDYALQDENLYMLKCAQEKTIEAPLKACLQAELAILQELGSIKSADVRRMIPYEGFLPDWDNSAKDFTAVYMERMDKIRTHGYGIFAKYHMFTVSGSRIVPVRYPDETRLSDLSGYSWERKCVIDNTLALLEGKPAANVLLYGDSGTGKSSTVKAVANEFAPRGLRLIEIKKKQLREIPALIESLGKNPLKFILFIDDLSFTKDDDDFGALKAILEGSVSARTSNLAVYATSNRRHLVRETFSDREGDEVHANDTVQQLVSLSDRFGLTITFSRPDKAQYLSIVSYLAELYGIDMDEQELYRQAEIYALERGGRSPRVAKQFLEQVQSIGV